MRFLCNENFPIAGVRVLREAGHEVAAVGEDSPGVKDAQVLMTAARNEQVIITFDRDYGDLIFRLRLARPAGVLYLRFDPLTPTEPGELVARLVKLPGLKIEGMFSVVSRQDVRQRPLPSGPRPIKY